MAPELERILMLMVDGCQNEGAAIAAFTQFLHSLKLDHFTLGFVASYRSNVDLLGIWTSLPDEWMEEYFACDYEHADYVIQKAAEMDPECPMTAIDWGQRTLRQGDIGKDTCQVLRGAADAGMAEAISFIGQNQIGDCPGHFASSIGSTKKSIDEVFEIVERHRNELLIASFGMISVLRPETQRRFASLHFKLTSRERDVLARFAQGMRPDRIADSLGITKRTVDMHAGNARNKMQARTIAEATARAGLFGLI